MTTIYDTIRMYKLKGMTRKQSIEEVESILRCEIPEPILALIYQEVEP